MPERFKKIYSDFGEFSSPEDVPEKWRYSPETRKWMAEEARRAAEEKRRRFLAETDMSKGSSKPVRIIRIDLSKLPQDSTVRQPAAPKPAKRAPGL